MPFLPKSRLPDGPFGSRERIRRRFVSYPLALVFSLWAGLILANPVFAQAGEMAEPAPDSPAPQAASPTPADAMAHLVSNAIPTIYFITTASRLAISKTQNGKLLQLAQTLVKEQTPAGASLAPFVNVNNAVVSLRSPFTGKVGPGARRLAAPNLLPSQAADLRTLSSAQNGKFDGLYISMMTAALTQLQTFYSDYSLTGTDKGLNDFVRRELPKVERSHSAFEAF